MVGTMYRVNVFDSLLSDSVILAHAKAWLTGGQRPKLAIDLAGANVGITLSQGITGTHYRIEYQSALAGTWTVLQDIPALSGTSIRVVDPTPVAGPRFYRAAQLP